MFRPLSAEAVRAELLQYLKDHPHECKTGELSKALFLDPGRIRRAGHALANQSLVRVQKHTGRGNGEYGYTILQSDLFPAHRGSKLQALWQRITTFLK